MVGNRGGFVHDGVEPAVLVGSVVNGAHRTVRFDQGVLALDDIPVAGFVLALNVTGVEVVHSVLEGVLWWGLKGRVRV